MTIQDALAAAALQLVGVPFRLNGRDPARGLDCLGVLVVSLAAVGRTLQVPLRYRLRRANIDEFLSAAPLAGLLPVRDDAAPGDVIVARPGPAQFHAAIITSGGFVHAHAGLGRVVLSPAPAPWPVEHHWRPLAA